MTYNAIVVGSGNGACGFLSHYLGQPRNERVLVVEEGEDFFYTSDITHQNNWTESYAEGNVFKLHNALTADGRPIISGRACTMGGGGSINYTMIHESSEWLSTHIGQTVEYWDKLKQELNGKFTRPKPQQAPSPITKSVLQVAQNNGFKISNNKTCHIPNFWVSDTGLLHLFPTQFDQFGQRTNSGVSIVDWFHPPVELKTRCKVLELKFTTEPGGKAQCVGVWVQYIDTKTKEFLSLAPDGKLVLCAGAATPRLLWPHREELNNQAIGQHVSDHIVLPLGIYIPDNSIAITGRDVYIPVFATTEWQPETQGKATVCCFDFFSGNFEKLWFIIAHLYLAFLLPNWLKKIVIRVPWLFYLVKNAVRIFIQFVNFIINFWWDFSNLIKGKGWQHEDINLITAIVKFNPAVDGSYQNDRSAIELNFFGKDQNSQFNQDKVVAKSEIAKQLPFLDGLGKQPPGIFKCFFRWLTKIPYEASQVDRYVEVYSRKFLLSEQHLSGGCLFGEAIDKGLNNPADTGKLFGSNNVYVADLSSVPLPRISPQMTAYLVGFHVAKKLSS